MSSGHAEIDEQIERLRKGDTLAENEVKALCDKVSNLLEAQQAPTCCGLFRQDGSPFLHGQQKIVMTTHRFMFAPPRSILGSLLQQRLR